MIIRQTKIADVTQIAEIYNFYVQNTHHTFETDPVIFEEMQRRISEIVKDYQYLVFEENKEILAFAYAAQYKSRRAYQSSAEVSVYVKNGAGGKGIGTSLYEKLLAELSETDVRAVIAGIALPNEASIGFTNDSVLKKSRIFVK